MQTIERRRVIALAGAGLGLLGLPSIARAVSISTAARPLYDYSLMTIGQSLAQQIDLTHEAYALVHGISSRVVTGVARSVEIINRAAGGSASCIENLPTAGSNYWVNWNGGLPTSGPLLTQAVADVASRTAAGTPVWGFVFDQGQQDVIAASGNIAGLTAAQAVIQYVASWTFAFTQLQAAVGAFGPSSIYIVPLGRATAPGVYDSGYEAIRKAQIDSLIAINQTIRVADDYDLALYNNVHPDRSAHDAYGDRIAVNVAWAHFGATTLRTGPTITGLIQPDSTSVEVQISAESTDLIDRTTDALGPCGFKFYDGTTPLLATFKGWNGNNPQWNLPSSPATLKMSFPSGGMGDFRPRRLIRGLTSKYPLASRYM